MTALLTDGIDAVHTADDHLAAAVLRDCLAQFQSVRLTVTGDCMRPCLMAGDAVLVTGALRRAPMWGDVVLVRHDAGLRLHRLIWGPPLASRGSRWLTKGDRAAHWDRWIAPEEVLGIVTGTEPSRVRADRGRVRRTARSMIGGAASWLWRKLREP